MPKPQPKEIIAFVQSRFSEYTNSTAFQNWKLQSENIRDAVDQRYRAGEQLTRSGFYFAAMRAARDGFKEGFTDVFGQADPLILYDKRRGVPQELADVAQETMDDTWEDIDGLAAWLSLTDDAIDYGTGIGYVRWDKQSGDVEKPVVKEQAWGEGIEWEDEFDILLDQPVIDRIHPFNWRGDLRKGDNLKWEGCEWEWTLEDLFGLLNRPGYDKQAVKRAIDKMAKGQLAGESDSYYNTHDELNNEAVSVPKAYAREYWGPLSEVTGMERDRSEYCIVCIGDELLKFTVNRITGRNKYRPFTRVRLSPMNDLPIGRNILAPTLPHSKLQNLMLNLGTDDVLIRQHLGLAAWADQLQNPNDLVNPEGARGVLWMKANANPNLLPRFYADGRSGVLSDALTMNDQIERDKQMAGLNDTSLGINGGVQDGTATAARFLASAGNRRSRAAIIWACNTGLKPIARQLMVLNMRYKGEDLGLQPRDLAELWSNNFWEVDDAVTRDQASEALQLAEFAQIALPEMMKITTADGSAGHVVKFLKDMGAKKGIKRHKLDEYFPEGMPANAGPAAPPQMQGAPQGEPQGPIAQPMAFAEPTEEELAPAG